MNIQKDMEISPGPVVARHSDMISISEEIMLLMLDYDHGCANYGMAPRSVQNAISGSILMDLAIQDRIDTDLDNLLITDSTPTGNAVLDEVLSRMIRERHIQHTPYWIRILARDHETIQFGILDRLVERGILVRIMHERYLVMGSGHFMAADGTPFRDVRRRIAGVLLDDEIPSPRDVTIISLITACGLWGGLIDKAEMDLLIPRIELIAGLDLIGRSVAGIVTDCVSNRSR